MLKLGWKTMLKTVWNSEAIGKFVFISFLLFFLISGVTRNKQKSDFLDYYHASQRWGTGENLYKFDTITKLTEKLKDWQEIFLPENAALLDSLQNQTGTYIYPPLFSFLLIPFGKLDPSFASGLHSILNWFCLVGIFYILSKIRFFENQSKISPWIYVLTILANFRYLESHVQNNQVGLLLIFLVLSALVSKNDLLSGVLLALATVIKVTPIVFIVIFIYEKRFKAVLYFLAGLIFWNAIPLLYRFDYTIVMTKEWFTQVLGQALSNPLARSWKNNQSLSSTLAKYFYHGADFVNQPLYRLPFVDLSLNTIKWIQNGIIVLFGLPILYLLKKPNLKWHLTSLLFLASCLFSGISWVHSFVICIFPIYFLILHKENHKWTRAEKNWFLITIALVLLTHRSFVGGLVENIFLMYSILFYLGASLYLFIISVSLRNYESRN